jgi:hypothetical protein
MTSRETAIAKIQHLPESLLPEINAFIDFITQNHQPKTGNYSLASDRAEAWAQWFEATDGLELLPTPRTSEYQQRLLDKYRQQGLSL